MADQPRSPSQEEPGLGDKTAFAGVVIGIAVAVAGVALPLAFDIAPAVWRSVFCGGVLLTLGVSAYLVHEHFLRPRSWKRGTRLLQGGTAVLAAVVVSFSVVVPQPTNYGALILAKINEIDATAYKPRAPFVSQPTANSASVNPDTPPPHPVVAAAIPAARLAPHPSISLPKPDPQAAAQPNLDRTIYVSCGWSQIPDRIPATGWTEMEINLNWQQPVVTGYTSLLPGSPNNSKSEASPSHAEVCVLRNYGKEAVLDLTGILTFTFFSVVKEGNVTRGGAIVKRVKTQAPIFNLGPNEVAAFWLRNYGTDTDVTVDVPEYFSARPVGYDHSIDIIVMRTTTGVDLPPFSPIASSTPR